MLLRGSRSDSCRIWWRILPAALGLICVAHRWTSSRTVTFHSRKGWRRARDFLVFSQDWLEDSRHGEVGLHKPTDSDHR